LGNPRKIYQVNLLEEKMGYSEDEIVGKLSEVLKKCEEGETNHCLKVLQSNDFM
jgi:hypothetical protein